MNKNGLKSQKDNDQDLRSVYIYSNATICPKDEQLEMFHGKRLNFI